MVSGSNGAGSQMPHENIEDAGNIAIEDARRVILGWGDRAVKMPDISIRKNSYSTENYSIEDVLRKKAVLDNYLIKTIKEYRTRLLNVEPDLKSSDGIMAALRMISHDQIYNALNNYHIKANGFDIDDIGEDASVQNPENANSMLVNAMAAKHLLALAAFYASEGDKKYITEFSTDDLADLISVPVPEIQNGGYGIALPPNNIKDMRMTSLEYAFIAQTLKNAIKYGEPKYSLSAEDFGDSRAITMSDSGKGLKNQRGEFVKLEEVPELFKPDYTSGGTGLGLFQLAKISQLTNDTIIVHTSNDGIKSIVYPIGGEPEVHQGTMLHPGTSFIYYAKKPANLRTAQGKQ